MFKFDFVDVGDVDEATVTAFGEIKDGPVAVSSQTSSSGNATEGKRCVELPMEELLGSLPPAISFSPLTIPLSRTRKARNFTLARRDLFDARFQLISLQDLQESASESGASDPDLTFVDAPSDLVPGIYEGGLKTWECSLDLVDCLYDLLSSSGDTLSRLRGNNILELGCGTAIPSLYVIHQLLSRKTPAPEQSPETCIDLQDYNDLVLRLVTLPNVILTWYMSPASHSFRVSNTTEIPDTQDDPDLDTGPLPPADPTQPGSLPLTPALLSAFSSSLHAQHIRLRFIFGSWESFSSASGLQLTDGYDLVLSSETIYRPESLPALVNVLRRAESDRRRTRLTRDIERLALYPSTGGDAQEADRGVDGGDGGVGGDNDIKRDSLCLVAAKRVYFGVGGGVAEFVHAIEQPPGDTEESTSRKAGRVQTVWEKTDGVQRIVMRVNWT